MNCNAEIKLIIRCVLVALFMPILSNAQDMEAYKRMSQNRFREFKGAKEKEYIEYREKVNAEFAEFMRRPWEKYEALPAQPVPVRPEPLEPVVKKPDTVVEPVKKRLPSGVLSPVSIRIAPPSISAPDSRINLPRPEVRPDTDEAPGTTEGPGDYGFRFEYYGTECRVPLYEDMKFRLSSVSENAVADMWEALSNDRFWTLAYACYDLRKRMSLCDWGYVRLVEKLSTTFFGPDMPSEASLLQMYILTQSGYKVRMARKDDRLVLLLPSDNDIWQYPFLRVDNLKYFILNSHNDDLHGYYLYNQEFPKEQMFSLDMGSAPILAEKYRDEHTFVSEKFPEAGVSVSVNSNLMDFYDDYPLSNDLNIYAAASLSKDVKSQIYPSLMAAINGKSEFESTEIILNFVQTAFEYKIDNEQFGYEKPFFADEIFNYPFCDCEDRSILFSVLIYDLLGLDVVLVNYPEHIATAVNFTEDVHGAYFDLDGRHYTICDPTYIGAPVGDVMPQFVNSSANIIQIW